MDRTMKLHKISLLCATLISVIISVPEFHVTEAAGFSIDLIHRDSLNSPSLYSSSERVKTALQRSFNRAKILVKDYSPQSATTEIVPDRGEYLMKFSLGTPRVETLAIADTGSDLTWIQCKPCKLCFRQKAPLFNPNHSSTYKPVSCNSNTCNDIPIMTSCDGSKGTCSYKMSYGDRSYSKGDVATETITLGSTTGENVSIPNVVMGCGRMDQGTFTAGASGIVGLGDGEVSLVRQMGSSIQGKFSYCLVPFFLRRPKPSKMNFGDHAVVSGGDVATTPIVAKTPATFYFLTLEGMTVGNQKFNLVSSPLPSSPSSSLDNDYDLVASGEGNIIIDSGTTLTFLPRELYYQVEEAVKKQTNLRKISDPQRILNLCYISTRNAEKNIPEITAHFRGADVKLKTMNTFVRTSKISLCLAFAPATSIAIYGNLAQMDFLVGYDLQKKSVSFKPTDCSKA